MTKTVAEIMYQLFGPNGSNQIIHRNQRREFAVYKELERHGLVKLAEKDPTSMPGLFTVERTCHGLQNKAA